MFDMGSHTSATAVYPRCRHLHTHTYNLYYRCKLLLHMWPLHSPPRSADCLNFFLPSSLVDFFPSVHRSVILCIVVTHISNRARTPTPQVKNLGHMPWRWGDKLIWERPGSTPKARPRSLRSSITFYKLGERQRKKKLCVVGSRKQEKEMYEQTRKGVCLHFYLFFPGEKISSSLSFSDVWSAALPFLSASYVFARRLSPCLPVFQDEREPSASLPSHVP